MRYRPLGGTGIQVSPYCLGTMMLGAVGNADHDDCVRIIHTALDRGINLVDTADMYSAGESEEIVGRALQGRRDDVVLATKVYFPMGEDPNERGGSRRWIIRGVEASLRRLRTDWIDLYQIHRYDPTTDLEETLGALTDLVRQGKVRAFGCSTFPASVITESHHVADRRGLYRFRTEQPPYSMLARSAEAEVLPTCQRHHMGVLSWSPLGFGYLTGRYRQGRPVDLSSGRPAVAPGRFDPMTNATKLAATERLAQLAEEIGVSLARMAIAFVLAHPAITSVILGPRTWDQLTDLLDGAETLLYDATLDRIDEIVPPGTDTYAADSAWRPASLTTPSLRRRPLADRAAA